MQLTPKGRKKADAAAAEYGVGTTLAACRAASWHGTNSEPLRRSCGVTLTEEERRAVMYVFGNVSKGIRALAISRSLTLADVVRLFRESR